MSIYYNISHLIFLRQNQQLKMLKIIFIRHYTRRCRPSAGLCRFS